MLVKAAIFWRILSSRGPPSHAGCHQCCSDASGPDEGRLAALEAQVSGADARLSNVESTLAGAEQTLVDTAAGIQAEIDVLRLVVQDEVQPRIEEVDAARVEEIDVNVAPTINAILAVLRNEDLVPIVTEDANGNGMLDDGEDANQNGVLDDGEDTNENGVLDDSEDANGNGSLDVPIDDISSTGPAARS